MKIAFLFGTMHRGGAERVIASLANTFSAWGDEVSIITLDDSPSGYALASQVKHIRLSLAGTSRNIGQAIVRNTKMIKELRILTQRENYDVVFAFDLRLAILLQYAHPIGRKYKIITSERANPLVRKLGKLEIMQQKLLLPNVDGFVFQTKRVSKCYCEKLQRKGTVIHNGVFDEILPTEIPTFEQRRNTEICAVGRLDVQKGYDVLLQAFKFFLADHPTHRLHIYGEGNLRPILEEQISKLGLNNTVMLHGSVPNVMYEVADMGMFVLASRFEGMPNALMEAMACGIPCVSTDCDFGPGELIENGNNGLLVPVDDATALAKAMKALANDKELAKGLCQNAQKIRRKYREYIERIVSSQ